MAAAPIAQRVERAIAEQAVELLRISICVAGEIFAVGVAEETMTVVHSMLLLWRDKLPPVWGGSLWLKESFDDPGHGLKADLVVGGESGEDGAVDIQYADHLAVPEQGNHNLGI